MTIDITRVARRFHVTAIVTVAVVLLSLLPLPEEMPLGDVTMIDKWTHLVMYGGLAWAAWLEFAHLPLRWRRLAVALLFPVALGGVLEVMQEYLTTYRSGEWMDFWADSLGTLLGCVAGWITVCCVPRTTAPGRTTAASAGTR